MRTIVTGFAIFALAAVTVMSSATLTLAQDSAPQPDLEPIKSVKIGPNREFLVNDKPFLPIMSWAQTAKRPEHMKLLRSLGFNTINSSHGADVCEAAASVGMYAISHFSDADKKYAGNPRLLAWIHRDEPDMPEKNKTIATPDAIEGEKDPKAKAGFTPKEPPAVTAERYQQIKQLDKSRPVLLTFTGHFFSKVRTHYTAQQQAALYPQYVKVADVLGFDIYPVYGHGTPGKLNQPAEATAELVKMGGNRPVYAWIEANKGSRWMTYEKQPDVLPEYTRYQIWSVLINGATGYGYFTHAWRPSFSEFAPNEAMRAEMLRVNSQVTRLAPAILAPAAKNKVEMNMSDNLGCRFKATSYQGDIFIFAQNADLGENADKLKQFEPISPRTGTATFSVAGLKAGTKIEVVDEDRTITAENGKFTDEFGPLAEHIYKIKL